MVKLDRENNPNAGLFISALRNLGYDNISALNDIFDNALDADASRIVIQVYKNDKGKIEIVIADDGYGMDLPILDQALRLGSDVEHEIESKLGKFGMGLSTASIAIARALEVLTKQKGSDVVLKSVQDIDTIIRTNKFVKYLGTAEDDAVEFFNAFLDDKTQGTIVRLIDCDKLTNKNIGQFTARLIKEIGRVFREYINAGREFYVNGTKVEAEDIFMLSEGGEIYSDETYEVAAVDANGKPIVETIRVRLGILPDFGVNGNRDRKINASTQGFYVMRNNREVEKNMTLGFYARHPQFNRFRGEIYFTAVIDDQMGINFRKTGVDMEQSIYDRILATVKHQIRAIGNILIKSKAAKEATGIDHTESERQIARKTPLLKTPDPKEEPKKPKKDDEEKKGRGPDKEPRKPRQEQRAKFVAEHGGKGGHFYEARMEGKTVVIAWNIDHPFYERFVVGTKEDKTLATSVDFMVFSMATAELGLMDDTNIQMIENFKTIMSMNLNTLLR